MSLYAICKSTDFKITAAYCRYSVLVEGMPPEVKDVSLNPRAGRYFFLHNEVRDGSSNTGVGNFFYQKWMGGQSSLRKVHVARP